MPSSRLNNWVVKQHSTCFLLIGDERHFCCVRIQMRAPDKIMEKNKYLLMSSTVTSYSLL